MVSLIASREPDVITNILLRFYFSVLSEEIATRTKVKKAGEVLNHRGHRGHRERPFDFPLCPLWLALLLSLSSLWFRLRRPVLAALNEIA